jgi:hypothetical protein
MRAAQQQAAAAGAGGSGGSSASMGSMGKKPALSKKEQKKQEELQKQKEKAMLAAQKKQQEAQKKAQATRQKAYTQAQRTASKRGAQTMAKQRGGGGNALGAVFSLKGALVLGSVGYLWVAQRPLLLAVFSKLFQYPMLLLTSVVRSVWSVLLKPILRKLVLLKAGSKSAGGELPGGAY